MVLFLSFTSARNFEAVLDVAHNFIFQRSRRLFTTSVRRQTASFDLDSFTKLCLFIFFITLKCGLKKTRTITVNCNGTAPF